MTSRLTRRNLLIGGAVAAVLPVGLVGSHALATRSGIVMGYLRGQFPGLAISDTNLQGFASEFLDRYGLDFTPWYAQETLFAMLDNPALAARAPARIQPEFEKLTRELVTKFLLSTDFFGAAEQRPERTTYLGFIDPYASACSNPLAKLGSLS